MKSKKGQEFEVDDKMKDYFERIKKGVLAQLAQRFGIDLETYKPNRVPPFTIKKGDCVTKEVWEWLDVASIPPEEVDSLLEGSQAQFSAPDRAAIREQVITLLNEEIYSDTIIARRLNVPTQYVAWFRHVVGVLPMQHYKALVLERRLAEGHSPAEIATLEGVSEAFVHKVQNYIRLIGCLRT